MRHCPRCKETKPLVEFYNRRGKEGNSVYCKPCTNNQTLERQRKLKKQSLEYKGNECSVCGYNKCEAALEFHHIDPAQKDFTLGNAHLTSFEKVKSELDKCALLCANCHREVHAGLIKL